jgi:serine/threonine protein kinase
VVTRGDPLVLIISFCEHGSLLSMLIQRAKAGKPLELGLKLKLGLDVARGMKHLVDAKFIHRDLAARNVLVGSGTVGKVADFGLARGTATTSTVRRNSFDGAQPEYFKDAKGVFPIRWTAPEAMDTFKYTTATDVWSFGIVLVEIFQDGKQPYSDITDNTQVMTQVLGHGYKHPRPAGCSIKIYESLLECWADQPEDRPSFDGLIAILHYNWFNISDEQAIEKKKKKKKKKKSAKKKNTNSTAEANQNNYEYGDTVGKASAPSENYEYGAGFGAKMDPSVEHQVGYNDSHDGNLAAIAALLERTKAAENELHPHAPDSSSSSSDDSDEYESSFNASNASAMYDLSGGSGLLGSGVSRAARAASLNKTTTAPSGGGGAAQEQPMYNLGGSSDQVLSSTDFTTIAIGATVEQVGAELAAAQGETAPHNPTTSTVGATTITSRFNSNLEATSIDAVVESGVLYRPIYSGAAAAGEGGAGTAEANARISSAIASGEIDYSGSGDPNQQNPKRKSKKKGKEKTRAEDPATVLNQVNSLIDMGFGDDGPVSGSNGTVLVFDRKLHSRMPLFPRPARVKRASVCPMAFLSGVHSSYRLAL